MLKRINTPNNDIVTYEVRGMLTREDYINILIPLVEKAELSNEKIKFLIHFGDHFEGFSAGAVWEDFKIGIHHLRLFERIAIVSNKQWLLDSISFFSSMIPCSIRSFKNNDIGDGLAWLDSGDIGFDHSLDKSKGIVTVEIHAPISSDNFYVLSSTVDEWIKEDGELNGLVIHIKDFSGWEGIGGFLSHLYFIKDHHKKINKVALSADSKFAVLIPRIAKHFVVAEIKHFNYDELGKAKDWATKY